MIKDVLSSLDGIEIYPIIGMIFFILVFAGSIIRVMKIDKKEIERMSNLPLENGDTINDFKGNAK